MIEKPPYQLPEGIAPSDQFVDVQASTDIGEEIPDDVEIVPDSMGEDGEMGDMGMLMDLEEASGPPSHRSNLVYHLSDSKLVEIANEITDLVHQNSQAREEWSRAYRRGIELLGIRNEERQRPWRGASGVTHPLLMETLFRFQSEVSVETFRPGGPVKPNIMGEETPEKASAAHRVARDMNFYLTDRMPEYRSEHERMLWTLGLAGQAFKKVYHDAGVNRPRSDFVPPEDVIIPWYTNNVYEPEWAAHVMRKSMREIERLKASGFYADEPVSDNVPTDINSQIREIKQEIIGVSESSETTTSEDDGQVWLIEMHWEKDIEEDDAPKPYVVTIDLNSYSVLSIYRNWEEDDSSYRPIQYFAPYGLIPGFGAYAFGYAHLLGGIVDSATKTVRQLIDAGTLANLPGGFKTRGLRIKSGDTPVAPGEFKDVDVASGKIQENIMPLPFKEPSQVLFGLYQNMVGEGRSLASMDDIDLKGMTGETPVGTIIAVLDKMFKPMTAIQSRVHHAMRNELRILKRIIRTYAPDTYGYDNGPATRQDYDIIDVSPVSDPNASSVAVRMMQAQYALQLMAQKPELYDQMHAHRMALSTAGIPQVDKLVPDRSKVPPLDPVTETMAIMTGKPVKAFPDQDHEAHIRVHMNTLQDPMIRARVGQSPNANQMMATMMSHIQEHVAFQYRRDVEQALGTPLPPPGKPMPPELEAGLARGIADATDKVLGRNKSKAAEQQMQDPVVQLQMRDQALKEREQEFREQKHKDDKQIDQAKIMVDSAKQLASIDAQSNKARIEAKLRAAEKLADVEMQENLERMRQRGREAAERRRTRTEIEKARIQAVAVTRKNNSKTPNKE